MAMTSPKKTNQRAMKKGTSIIKYVKDKHLRATAKRAFHLWQIRPHEVAPLSNTPCKCACCGTEFVGNFCPRCGQSASVNRFSLKQAIDLFLDVWDVNNRSVFRTMRDMLLRPGYMIRDYLNGMQAGYFSPFKMFFLLATLSLLVENGFFFKPGETSDNTGEDIVSEMEAASKRVKELREEKGKDSLALTSDIVEPVLTTDEVATAPTMDEEEVNAATKADNDSISKTEIIRKRLDRRSKDPNVQMLHKVGTMISKFADDNPALFVTLRAPHERIQIGGIEHRLREMGKRLNIPKVHPHKFRRTLATMAIDKGMPIEQLQRLLGHQRIDTTLQYAMVKQSNVKTAHRKYIR